MVIFKSYLLNIEILWSQEKKDLIELPLRELTTL